LDFSFTSQLTRKEKKQTSQEGKKNLIDIHQREISQQWKMLWITVINYLFNAKLAICLMISFVVLVKIFVCSYIHNH
jgi:hypothetical protein